MPTREINKLFGARIRELRKAQNWTQEDLAEHAELSVDSIGAIERGISSPVLETQERLAKALGLSLAHLMDFEEASSSPASREIESLRLYLRDKDPEDIRFLSDLIRQFMDKLEQARTRSGKR